MTLIWWKEFFGPHNMENPGNFTCMVVFIMTGMVTKLSVLLLFYTTSQCFFVIFGQQQQLDDGYQFLLVQLLSCHGAIKVNTIRMHERIWLIKEVELWAETCHTLGLTSRLHNVFLLCLWRPIPTAALDKMDGTSFKAF